MSAPTILIAGYSGRALAASARRAGYRPLVVDAFCDQDTRELCSGECEVVDGAYSAGFTASRLVPALERLRSRAISPPIGLILAAGFEDAPRLIGRLDRSFTLLGCGADVVRRCKDPAVFFPLLAELGIPHPQTSLSPPVDGHGWLTKRTGGSGGTHIARCRARPGGSMAGRYFQREAEGRPVSLLGVAGRRSTAFAPTRSWLAPAPRRPFRFGGITGGIDLDSDTEARLASTALDLVRALNLVGLVTFDFVLTAEGPLLLEVNPRAAASLDVLDDEAGTLFNAHLAAIENGDPAPVLEAGWRPKPTSAAYLYADTGPITVGAVEWPDMVTDRPAAGTAIASGKPVCTVQAQAPTADEAEQQVALRLGHLKRLLYGGEKNIRKETPR